MTAQSSKMIKDIVSWLGVASGVFALIFSTGAFVENTKQVTKEIPMIKQQLQDHINKDMSEKSTLKDAMSEIKTDVKVIETKVDDMKKYGQGQYHQETQETITRLKRKK